MTQRSPWMRFAVGRLPDSGARPKRTSGPGPLVLIARAVLTCPAVFKPSSVLPAGFVAPCLPTKAAQPPSGGLWLHEIKHDGFRVIAPEGQQPCAALQPDENEDEVQGRADERR
jgi:hypothetical protein